MKSMSEDHFTNFRTTFEQYEKGEDFHANKDMKHFFNYNNYKDVKGLWPLNTYGCIKTNGVENVEDDIENMFYISVSEFYSLSVNDIFQKIAEDLDITKIKINTEMIENPVYVIVYQAPFLRFNDEEIVARNDSINNFKPSFNQKINDVTIGEKKLYTKIIVMYPNYKSDTENSSRIIKQNGDTGFQKFKQYFNNSRISRDKLCFLKCNGVNDYGCGCINRENSDNSLDFYKSKCTDMENNEFNYGMIYQLNYMNKIFSNKIKYVQ
jgi:hypothetical protein